MGRQDGVAIGLAMATGCKIAGHPFDFGHDLKHFKHSFGAKLGDDCAPSGPEFDEPDGALLHQPLTYGGSQHDKPGGKLNLVQAFTGSELSRPTTLSLSAK